MKNYQCLYVKKIFIGIIYALECKLNPCSNGILKYAKAYIDGQTDMS